MSITLDEKLTKFGTRFLLYPQFSFRKELRPDVVYISIPKEIIKEGPSDDRLYVVRAKGKDKYSGTVFPPYNGPQDLGVKAGPDGHFDHLNLDDPGFDCASMYASVRRILDIWEDYFGHAIYWFFSPMFPRLELIPNVLFSNAQAGYGYIEFGFQKKGEGFDTDQPLCRNFDIIAHEFGHILIYSIVQIPKDNPYTNVYYRALHESFADMIAIVSSLHFESVIDYLMKTTMGNLFSVNILERIGDLADDKQLRNAFNDKKMSDVSTQPHELSLPLTGAIFDIFVEIFQTKLLEKSLISAQLARRASFDISKQQDGSLLKEEFEKCYKGNEELFKRCLMESRDYLGLLIAKTLSGFDPHLMTFYTVFDKIMRADIQLKENYQQLIRDCFFWREIGNLPPEAYVNSFSFHNCQCPPDEKKPDQKMIRDLTQALEHCKANRQPSYEMKILKGALNKVFRKPRFRKS